MAQYRTITFNIAAETEILESVKMQTQILESTKETMTLII